VELLVKTVVLVAVMVDLETLRQLHPAKEITEGRVKHPKRVLVVVVLVR
jgi:hypothetical protein